MTSAFTGEPLEHPELHRFLRMLEGLSTQRDSSARFVNEIGARRVVAVLAQCLAGVGTPGPGVRRRLAELTREAVLSAGHSADLDTAALAADLGALLRSADDDVRVTSGVIVEWLLEPATHHQRVLRALARTVPADPPRTSDRPSLAAFLVDRPVEPMPRAALDRALRAADGA